VTPVSHPSMGSCQPCEAKGRGSEVVEHCWEDYVHNSHDLAAKFEKLLFAGAGVRGFAYNGFLFAVDQIMEVSFSQVVGASAGTQPALMYWGGVPADKIVAIVNMINFDQQRFYQPKKLTSWISLAITYTLMEQHGLPPGSDVTLQRIQDLIERPEGGARTVQIAAFDVSSKHNVLLSTRTVPHATVAEAARASSAVPGVLPPVRVTTISDPPQELCLFDGGLLPGEIPATFDATPTISVSTTHHGAKATQVRCTAEICRQYREYYENDGLGHDSRRHGVGQMMPAPLDMFLGTRKPWMLVNNFPAPMPGFVPVVLNTKDVTPTTFQKMAVEKRVELLCEAYDDAFDILWNIRDALVYKVGSQWLDSTLRDCQWDERREAGRKILAGLIRACAPPSSSSSRSSSSSSGSDVAAYVSACDGHLKHARAEIQRVTGCESGDSGGWNDGAILVEMLEKMKAL